jgi:selenide,water dikinase
VLSAALKKEQLSEAGYRQLIDTTTKLNTPGIALAQLDGVHALTDVTGFGLAGHVLELARGAGLTAVIEWSKVPLLEGVEAMVAEGFVTGASGRNWEGYGADVQLAEGLPKTAQSLLSDPQTSGGLLVSCSAEAVDAVLEVFRAEGFGGAAVVGRIESGSAGLQVHF